MLSIGTDVSEQIFYTDTDFMNIEIAAETCFAKVAGC